MKIKIGLLSFGVLCGYISESFAQAEKPVNKPEVNGQKVNTKKARRHLAIESNTAEIIRLEEGVAEVFVANPDIADVALQTTGTAYVYGKRPGTTTIYASDKKGVNLLNLEVQVTHNVGSLKRAIARSYPNEDVEIISTPAGIILEGDVSSPKASADVVNIVKRYMTNDDVVVNNMGIAAPSQVYLQVRVAEINRSVLKQLDISWGAQSTNVKNFAFGLLTGRAGILNPVNNIVGAAGVGGNFLKPTSNTSLNTFGATATRGTKLTASTVLDALNTEGLATILAEPNLIALSGETSKVLVGGEVPYLVPQGSSAISIEFKQYGISLDFTPTILSSNRINLRVRPEVSQLDYTTAVNVGDLKIPGFKTRRAETSVEMGSGDSLAIAGLYSNTSSADINGVPGLQDIPVLGALFRSTKFQRSETELVIMVTPVLVEPIKKKTLDHPLKNLKYATHLGMILGNRLNRIGVNTDVKPVMTHTGDIVEINNDASVKETTFEQTLASERDGSTTAGDASTQEITAIPSQGVEQEYETNLVGEAGFYTR